MKKLLLLLFLTPLFLIACTGDYQVPVTKTSFVATTSVTTTTKTVEPAVKKVIAPVDVPNVSVAVPAQEQSPAPQLSNDNYYTNSAGSEVHSPAYAPSVPAGASAVCGDGTYSFSKSRRGTCSHHGGVGEWLD